MTGVSSLEVKSSILCGRGEEKMEGGGVFRGMGVFQKNAVNVYSIFAMLIKCNH